LISVIGFLEEDEGRKVMWGRPSQDNFPFTIVKSDGGFTYDTSDLATIKQRIEEEKGDWLIYVTDAGQVITQTLNIITVGFNHFVVFSSVHSLCNSSVIFHNYYYY
jgi:arginyl-tRNA synthetase